MKYCAFLAILSTSVVGCASEQGDFSWITHTWTTDHGVYALDHVSKHRVDVTKGVRRACLGETYYFESESNAKTFDAHPWSYLYSDNVCSEGRPDRIDQN